MPVVLLHPLGLDGDSWALVGTPRIADAIRYDLLGHGARTAPAWEASLSAFADDVIDNTSGPLDLVGVSMGAAVAMEISLRRPARVRSLLVSGSSGGRVGKRQLEERAVTIEQSGMPGVVDGTLARWFSAGALERADHPGVAYARERLLNDDPSAVAAAWRALAGGDLWARLDRIAVPTTVLHAVDDASVSFADSQGVSDRIGHARLHVIPGPHLAYLEAPEEFATAVSDHLEWVDSVLRPTESGASNG